MGAVVVLNDISRPLDEVGDITSIEDVRKIISHQIDVVFHIASYGMSGREQVSMLYLLSEC
ncbi:unnamed protein product [Pocillopora meandrina]|uniref:Uncharacterized protein n=1 Tax=Pocillopora meandrina TaxID=46732 RepID=A0AAU9X6E6_9CNID|nr:unnamed protein product [Pocillopora meandrina]